MKKITVIQASIILFALFAGILAFQAPAPAGLEPLQFHFTLMFATILAILYIGTSLLFILGLKNFKEQLKKAYGYICVALIFLAIAQLQLVIFAFFNLWNNWWLTHGFIQIPYILAAVLLFEGVRRFSKLLTITTALNSWLVTAFLTVSAILVIYVARELFYPYTTHYRPDALMATGFIFITVLVSPILCSITSVLILIIKKHAGFAYANALAWFFMATLATAIAEWQVPYFTIFGFDNGWVRLGIIEVGLIVSGLLFLKAGHAFHKITRY